ncbi:MAG: AAA family ATPase, partial [Porphyromonadaceae bacterium]|nr:AAA family ATPase [Porphyromonadaceae bacterium]
MKIREIKLNKFKRFTDLTITGIPETAKLIILVGPNGCGKTSVFEGLNHWYNYKGFNQRGDKDYYIKEADKDIIESDNWYDNQVSILFHDAKLTNSDKIHGSFYFRTAYRNDPDFTTNSLSKQNNPKDQIKYATLMNTDRTVSENYQRLVSNTLSGVFDNQNDDKSVKDLR